MPEPAFKPVVRERRQIPTRRGSTIMESFGVYPGDRKLLIAIMDRLGCSKSEAFRTCVRLTAAQLGVACPPDQ